MRNLIPTLGLALLVLAGAALAAEPRTVQLRGADEVPARDTKATGHATFKLSDDGTRLDYELYVANIDNVVMARIHMSAAGQNGDVVAFLYGPVSPGGGRKDGKLSSGTITAANLVGPLAGQPLLALVGAMKAGNAYVNVHPHDGT